MPKLKVYRTAIGFHDAYVAAPSQKAALEAWGSDANLFARGIAELVTDEALAKEPLAAPGTVIKRLRGTTSEQLAALPKDKPAPRSKAPGREERATTGGRLRKRNPPPPSRAKLEAAERAVADAQKRHKAEAGELDQPERVLKQRRRELEKAYAVERKRLDRELDEAGQAYREAVDRYEG